MWVRRVDVVGVCRMLFVIDTVIIVAQTQLFLHILIINVNVNIVVVIVVFIAVVSLAFFEW